MSGKEDMVVTIGMTPESDKMALAVGLFFLFFSYLSLTEKPRSLLIVFHKLSPS